MLLKKVFNTLRQRHAKNILNNKDNDIQLIIIDQYNANNYY